MDHLHRQFIRSARNGFLIHAGQNPLRGRPQQSVRNVAYICMQSRRRLGSLDLIF
jgi:hypothetical protein